MRPDGDPTLFIGTFFGAILCLALAYFGWKYWKHKASEHWPKVAAKFEFGAVEVEKDRYGGNHFSVWMEFAYQVAGETYGGRYKTSLGGYTQEEANNLLESFRQGPLYIRYRPSKPKDCVCDPFRDVRP